MGNQIKANSTFAEDPSLEPSTQAGWLTTTCKHSARVSDPLAHLTLASMTLTRSNPYLETHT